MKKIVLMLVLLFVVAGCAAERYGAGIDKEAPDVKVKEVMFDPSFQGRTVNMSGIIVTQCTSNGCWFFLNDGTGQIFVNLGPNGFSLPPRIGKKAKVTGEVAYGRDGVQIVAKGVETR